jgi:DNA-binding transcriptional ArsR family regulator
MNVESYTQGLMANEQIRQLKADLLKALGQPTRLKILELLVDGERCVCEIFPAIQEEQSNISKHLAFLRGQGIVIADRRGMRVFYRLADKRVVKLLEDAEAYVKATLKVKASLVA